MLEKLKNIFRSDEFIASGSVFPNIDKNRIAKELDLQGEGAKRGKLDQPEAKSKTLDHLELDAISRVEELRRRGLENYEINQRVYSERLNLAGSARMQVETDASEAKSRFSEVITISKAKMVTPRDRVSGTFSSLNKFREKNKLERLAKIEVPWPMVIGLATVMVLIESALNAFLFAEKNSFGLFGGLMLAFLVSACNVAICSTLGVSTRFINCVNWLKKAAGVLSFIVFVGFSCVYNLAVAHFRDAAENIGEWREAGVVALATLWEAPFGLNAFESWILLLIGGLISVIAYAKTYSSFDPYPGYAYVYKDVLNARSNYIRHLEESISDLAEHREEAVETLREANDEVQRNINDSVDALFGQKALNANLVSFLEQCDIAANFLLADYRDANKAARTAEPPKYFNEKFSFSKFAMNTPDPEKKEIAQTHLATINEMVNAAIRDIFDVFDTAVKDHYEIDELQGTHLPRGEFTQASIAQAQTTQSPAHSKETPHVETQDATEA